MAITDAINSRECSLERSGDWFDNAVCGVFFHWGPYSVAGRGEWVMNRERISAEEYEHRYVVPWTADLYDADEWMAAASGFGAEYVVLTVRHHDGFALWDSRANPHNAMEKGPRRDLLAEFVEAAQRHGLRVGLYYSLANWIHPDYPKGFYRDWPSNEDWSSDAARERFMEYNRAELRELLTQYGPIDYIWFDGHYPENLRSDELNSMLRELQPGILINDRNGPTGDVRISEQGIRDVHPGSRWEACFTLNSNWGYHKLDTAHKRPDELLELLFKVRTQGGNLLLNVGPCGRGCIPRQTSDVLETCGEWILAHKAILTDTDDHGFGWNNSVSVLRGGGSLYLVFTELPEEEFCWAETDEELLEAKLLSVGVSVPFEQKGVRIHLKDLQSLPRDLFKPVIELRFAKTPEPKTSLTTFWIPG